MKVTQRDIKMLFQGQLYRIGFWILIMYILTMHVSLYLMHYDCIIIPVYD